MAQASELGAVGGEDLTEEEKVEEFLEKARQVEEEDVHIALSYATKALKLDLKIHGKNSAKYKEIRAYIKELQCKAIHDESDDDEQDHAVGEETQPNYDSIGSDFGSSMDSWPRLTPLPSIGQGPSTEEGAPAEDSSSSIPRFSQQQVDQGPSTGEGVLVEDSSSIFSGLPQQQVDQVMGFLSMGPSTGEGVSAEDLSSSFSGFSQRQVDQLLQSLNDFNANMGNGREGNDSSSETQARVTRARLRALSAILSQLSRPEVRSRRRSSNTPMNRPSPSPRGSGNSPSPAQNASETRGASAAFGTSLGSATFGPGAYRTGHRSMNLSLSQVPPEIREELLQTKRNSGHFWAGRDAARAIAYFEASYQLRAMQDGEIELTPDLIDDFIATARAYLEQNKVDAASGYCELAEEMSMALSGLKLEEINIVKVQIQSLQS